MFRVELHKFWDNKYNIVEGNDLRELYKKLMSQNDDISSIKIFDGELIQSRISHVGGNTVFTRSKLYYKCSMPQEFVALPQTNFKTLHQGLEELSKEHKTRSNRLGEIKSTKTKEYLLRHDAGIDEMAIYYRMHSLPRDSYNGFEDITIISE